MFSSARLVKMQLMICDTNYLRKYVTLTLGALRSNLISDLSGHKAYESIRLDERNTMMTK